MAEKADPRQVATFVELLMTVLYEQEALRVLVRKGVVTNDEVLEEIKAVRRELGGSVENRPRTGGFLFCGGHGGGT